MFLAIFHNNVVELSRCNKLKLTFIFLLLFDCYSVSYSQITKNAGINSSREGNHNSKVLKPDDIIINNSENSLRTNNNKVLIETNQNTNFNLFKGLKNLNSENERTFSKNNSLPNLTITDSGLTGLIKPGSVFNEDKINNLSKSKSTTNSEINDNVISKINRFQESDKFNLLTHRNIVINSITITSPVLILKKSSDLKTKIDRKSGILSSLESDNNSEKYISKANPPKLFANSREANFETTQNEPTSRSESRSFYRKDKPPIFIRENESNPWSPLINFSTGMLTLLFKKIIDVGSIRNFRDVLNCYSKNSLNECMNIVDSNESNISLEHNGVQTNNNESSMSSTLHPENRNNSNTFQEVILGNSSIRDDNVTTISPNRKIIGISTSRQSQSPLNWSTWMFWVALDKIGALDAITNFYSILNCYKSSSCPGNLQNENKAPSSMWNNSSKIVIDENNEQKRAQQTIQSSARGKKGNNMMDYIIVAAMISNGLANVILPVLQFMTMKVSMVINMVFMRAISATVRDMVFGERPSDKIIYPNQGYDDDDSPHHDPYRYHHGDFEPYGKFHHFPPVTFHPPLEYGPPLDHSITSYGPPKDNHPIVYGPPKNNHPFEYGPPKGNNFLVEYDSPKNNNPVLEYSPHSNDFLVEYSPPPKNNNPVEYGPPKNNPHIEYGPLKGNLHQVEYLPLNSQSLEDYRPTKDLNQFSNSGTFQSHELQYNAPEVFGPVIGHQDTNDLQAKWNSENFLIDKRMLQKKAGS